MMGAKLRFMNVKRGFNMKIVSYVYRNMLYHTRLIESPKFGSVIIGGYSLLDALTPSFNRQMTPEQKEIDDQIFFFLPNDLINNADDEKLIEIVEREVE